MLSQLIILSHKFRGMPQPPCRLPRGRPGRNPSRRANSLLARSPSPRRRRAKPAQRRRRQGTPVLPLAELGRCGTSAVGARRVRGNACGARTQAWWALALMARWRLADRISGRRPRSVARGAACPAGADGWPSMAAWVA